MTFEHELDRFRPIPFYFLTTSDPVHYTEEAVFNAMQRMKDLGYGGIVLFNKPPVGFDAEEYLSDFWFTVTHRFILAARKLNMQLWFNDGFNYPPGDAAGRIEKVAPGLKQRRLKPNPEGKLEILEVPWGFPAFEEPESGSYFRQFVYEEYYKRFAPYFGDGITGFFSDADNRRVNSINVQDFEEQYYPWSLHFAVLFEKRFGYRIENRLKELFSDPQSTVQHDYWLLCGELYQQWFAGNYAWCREHNVQYTFHTSDTGPLTYGQCRRSSAFTEGDPLALLSHSDCPGTDHEIMVLDGGTHYDNRYFQPKVTLGGEPISMEHPKLNNTFWDIRAKYASSAAYLNNKERVMCEMFAAANWGSMYNDLRRVAAWQIMQGINFIVPHAVHHLLCGDIKFFAPPEFTHTTLQYGLRQFNDTLARWCQAAASGEYCADYAVIEPTPKVWVGKDSTPFFQFCDQLNRRADGYVIVSENYSGDIANVIDPLKKNPDLPAPEISFSAGEIAFMRRKINGEEYLLAANIWRSETLCGTIVYRDKTYEIELEPGEIAILGGPFESYRQPIKSQIQKRFTGEYSVVWKEPNVIPFDRELKFTAPAGMLLTLLVPTGHSSVVRINGVSMISAKTVKVFDDDYCSIEFETAEKNVIELENSTDFTVPALLAGEFDVKLETVDDYAQIAYQQYALTMYTPREARFDLIPRRSTLDVSRGWEKQGQIFYSGEAVISLGVAQIQAGDYLELPEFQDIAELIIDGHVSARSSLSPYRFPLPEGSHTLQLRLWNRMANRFERYAAPAGLQSPPEIRHLV